MTQLTACRPDTLPLEDSAMLAGAYFDPFDPLDEDAVDDLQVLTSERRLRRLAIVSADTGARFAREGIEQDPAAWLLTPRSVFEGRRAIDACQDREAFLRATILHGLALGLDYDPAELDALATDDGDELDVDLDDCRRSDRRERFDPEPRLFSCVVEGPVGAGGMFVQAFCAMVVTSAQVMRRRLANRYGQSLASVGEIQEGFDHCTPVAELLLSDAVKRMLTSVACDPDCDLADKLDVQIERRFAA